MHVLPARVKLFDPDLPLEAVIADLKIGTEGRLVLEVRHVPDPAPGFVARSTSDVLFAEGAEMMSLYDTRNYSARAPIPFDLGGGPDLAPSLVLINRHIRREDATFERVFLTLSGPQDWFMFRMVEGKDDAGIYSWHAKEPVKHVFRLAGGESLTVEVRVGLRMSRLPREEVSLTQLMEFVLDVPVALPLNDLLSESRKVSTYFEFVRGCEVGVERVFVQNRSENSRAEVLANWTKPTRP